MAELGIYTVPITEICLFCIRVQIYWFIRYGNRAHVNGNSLMERTVCVSWASKQAGNGGSGSGVTASIQRISQANWSWKIYSNLLIKEQRKCNKLFVLTNGCGVALHAQMHKCEMQRQSVFHCDTFKGCCKWRPVWRCALNQRALLCPGISIWIMMMQFNTNGRACTIVRTNRIEGVSLQTPCVRSNGCVRHLPAIPSPSECSTFINAKCNRLEKHCLVIAGELLLWIYATMWDFHRSQNGQKRRRHHK